MQQSNTDWEVQEACDWVELSTLSLNLSLLFFLRCFCSFVPGRYKYKKQLKMEEKRRDGSKESNQIRVVVMVN